MPPSIIRDVLNFGWTEKFRRAMNAQGAPFLRSGGELQPGVTVDDLSGAEYEYLRGGRLFSATALAAAGVGNMSYVLLSVPAAPQRTLYLIEEIQITVFAANQNVACSLLSPPISFTVGQSWTVGRDDRAVPLPLTINNGTLLQIHSGNQAAAPGTIGNNPIIRSTGVAGDPFFMPVPWVLTRWALACWNLTVNASLRVTYSWRQREMVNQEQATV